MQYTYLIPLIFPLPSDYEFSLTIPPDLILRRLLNGRGAVSFKISYVYDSEVIHSETFDVEYSGSKNRQVKFKWNENGNYLKHGYAELVIASATEDTKFLYKGPPGVYGIYKAPDKPSFLSDGSYKFSSPEIINMIAKIGKFVDGYPAIAIDRIRDHFESLIFINPYSKPLLVSCMTNDGRRFKKKRIEAKSTIALELVSLLSPNEDQFFGRLQISANNRLLTYHMRHDNCTPRRITDLEHLDPYRADPTHISSSIYLRDRLARYLKTRYGIRL